METFQWATGWRAVVLALFPALGAALWLFWELSIRPRFISSDVIND
jgi:hypothetical protein